MAHVSLEELFSASAPGLKYESAQYLNARCRSKGYPGELTRAVSGSTWKHVRIRAQEICTGIARGRSLIYMCLGRRANGYKKRFNVNVAG